MANEHMYSESTTLLSGTIRPIDRVREKWPRCDMDCIGGMRISFQAGERIGPLSALLHERMRMVEVFQRIYVETGNDDARRMLVKLGRLADGE